MEPCGFGVSVYSDAFPRFTLLGAWVSGEPNQDCWKEVVARGEINGSEKDIAALYEKYKREIKKFTEHWFLQGEE
jgi:hypothetical protein